LPARDSNKKVDPFVKVYLGDNGNTTELRLVGVSETLTDNVNPDWNTVFKVRWNKGLNQVGHLHGRYTIITCHAALK